MALSRRRHSVSNSPYLKLHKMLPCDDHQPFQFPAGRCAQVRHHNYCRIHDAGPSLRGTRQSLYGLANDDVHPPVLGAARFRLIGRNRLIKCASYGLHTRWIQADLVLKAAIPRHMTWCKAPAASIRAWRDMSLYNHAHP